MIKLAGNNDLQRVERIMEEIRSEDPSFWPHGLTKEHFNGGLYMVQKSASTEPVGFVGYQKIPEGGKTIGYYAIGILPHHREQGFAKQAVTEVIRAAREECDDVRALIMAHNKPSKALAKSLDIQVIEKAASTKAKAIGSLLGSLGTTALFDQAANPERSIGSTFKPWEWDKERALMGGLNAILGGIGGTALANKQILGGAGAIALAPTKDLAMKGISTLHNVDQAAKESVKNLVKERNAIPSAPPSGSGENWVESIPKGVWAGAGALGAGLLGTILYTAHQRRKSEKERIEQENSGRVRVTLPTKAPGDAETQIELPVGDLNLSRNLREKLNRDYRRKLVAETKERTHRRKPREKAAAIFELFDELEGYKSAGAGPAPPGGAGGVPMPPPMGVNPAMRMQQQQQGAQANSIEATAANPKIMEAQQQNAQMQQEAQAQMQQMEQASQQAQMEQQAQFQQELAKKDSELEALRLENEKQKAMTELQEAVNEARDKANEANSQAATDKTNGEGSQAQRLISNRLTRVSSRIEKVAVANPAAMTPPTVAGQVTTPADAPITMHPDALQAANSPAATAVGRVKPTLSSRASYGPLGDTVFDWLFRKNMVTPKAKKPTLMSMDTLRNDPDRMRVMEQVLTGKVTTNPMLA